MTDEPTDAELLAKIRAHPAFDGLLSCVHTSGEWGDAKLSDAGELLLWLLTGKRPYSTTGQSDE